MINTSEKKSAFMKVRSFPKRCAMAQFLAACVLIQTLIPAVSAAPRDPLPVAPTLAGLPGRAGVVLSMLTTAGKGVAANILTFVNAAFNPQDTWTILLTPVATEFRDHTGIDHHEPTRKLVVSANSLTGQPNSLELLAADASHASFSNLAGLSGELLLATARDDGLGMSLGGFAPGVLFISTVVPGVVARINPDGASVQNPWVTLPNETGIVSGLHVDRTGVFGGDLLVVTTAGGVWRVSSSAIPTLIANLNTRLAGVTAVPDDVEMYGPWSAKMIVGAKHQGSIHAIDAQGQSTSIQVGINPQDIDIVPAHENFYAVDFVGRKIWGAMDGAFAGIIGDVLVAQESPGVLIRVRWNGTDFAISQVAQTTGFNQVAFSPAGVGQIPPVKRAFDRIAVVHHAPNLDSGRVEGTLWQLSAEDVVLNGTDTITNFLLMPGTPIVTASASASYGGTVEGTESTQPTDHTVTIGGRAQLTHVITRTDPIELTNIPLPPAPAGTRDVEIRQAGQTIGDPATLRNLSISGNAGQVVVPPGTYGKLDVAGRNVLVFGVESSSQPSVYNLEELSLTGRSELLLRGPVILRVRNKVTLVGSTVGAADDPRRLLLEVSTGAGFTGDEVKLSGAAVLYGIVRAPQGTITIEGTARLRGTVSCDYLFVKGNGVLQITENDIPPPPVNMPPVVDAGPNQTITLPNDTVPLDGTATDDGLPVNSTLSVSWTVVSGPGPVTFTNPHSALSAATLVEPGEYVLKLTASDGQLISSDTATITVVPRNQPPTVNAGPDQTIELPEVADLRGTVADDALPHGSTVSVTWSLVSGPGNVTFANPNAAATTASFSEPGVYTLRLTADDTEFTVSDDIVITVLRNEPPVVDAGPDQVITMPAGTNLNGVVTDDGLPRGSTLEIKWELVSGPAPVIFNDAFAAATPISFTVPGLYTLRLSASDSQLSASDEVVIEVRPKPFNERTYTLDADFAEGNLISVTQSVANQLQLDDTTQTFNFIWVAVSSKGTIVKINTETGAVIGEYFTSPSGQPKDPSRTTVDHNGSVWATNRAGNSVVHVGLVENGQCVDRNGNGVIDTSTGLNDIRSWPNTNGANTNGGVSLAQDECILHYTKVNSFGTRHVSVTPNNDIWVSGTSGRRFDLLDGITGQIKRAEPTVGFGGYGGLIDSLGVIWSARSMLRWDTSKPLTGPNGGNWRGYTHDSYGLCLDSQGNVWNTSYGPGTIRKFAPDGTQIGIFNQGASQAQGCVVDGNDHVWVAHSLNRNTVGHLKNDGTYVGTVTVGSGPTGVAVDGAGKIWATNFTSRTVSRIDPNLGPLGPDGVTRVGAVDFTTVNLGGSLYNYSDMTGSTLTGKPTSGTWSTVFDSQIAGAEWGRIGWSARMCGDALLSVAVSSSNDGVTFGPAETVLNGADPAVANGRYLKITVNFRRAASGESPVLYDLSVGTSGFTLPVPPNTGPSAFAGPDQTVTLPDAAKLNGAACDDGFPRGSTLALSWTKVSGPGDVAFTKPNATITDATFTLAGAYVLQLTAGDSEHSASDELTVNVLPANMAPIVNAGADQTITLPNSANLNGTASDDGFPVGSALTTFWSQLSGPGVVTFNDPNSLITGAIFPVPGTYTLRLAANDTHRIGTDDVAITVNASPALTGATLSLAAANVGPYVTGSLQPLRATLRNSGGNPLANYGVQFTVAGPNATTGSAVTNASGVATFSYAGTNPGTDTVTAIVRSTATINITSNSVLMGWSVTPQSPPVVQGWIGGPANGGSITGSVPITVGAGVTLTQATVEYWPASNPAAVTTLATGVQGGPGATLATLDTTLLANGNYVIRVSATDSNGQEQISQVIITVTGENKPGRLTFSITDLTVPVTGIPITIDRKYDSLERAQIGDFGYGWSLEIAALRLQVSPDNDVTLTEPGTGRRVTFQFTPTSFGFPFSFFYQPTYTPEPGVFGKLSSNGCGLLINSTGGFACFLSTNLSYSPTAFAYTDPYGRVYTMSATGEMHSIKNLDGNVLSFGPGGITSTAGNLTVPFVRDSQGRIEQITDPAGKVYTYTYDATGDLTTVKLPDVATPLRYEYDPGHFFRKGFDARGNPEATTTYYPNGRLQSVTDAMGKTTAFSYDLTANITTTTHPDNTGTTVQRFDSNGMLLAETDPLNRTKTFTYDANRNKRTETDALMKTTSYDYDANGHLRSVTDPLNKTISYTNNQVGLPVSVTDQLGKVRSLNYDASSNLTNIADELGSNVAFTWNQSGNPLTLTDSAGKVTRFTYDAFGNVLSKTDPLGRATSYTYDGMGRAETMTDARGVTRFSYDAVGRLLTITDPLNQVTSYIYDGNGNRIEAVDVRQQRTLYEYDALNRLIKVTYPDSTIISFTYNFRSQRLTETDQLNRTTNYVYDNAGQLLKIIRYDQTEVNFTYDELGRIKTATDERNKTTTYEYDQNCGCRNRMTKITGPDGKFSSYRYDDAGRRIAFIDANGRETLYSYDARDQLIRTTFFDGTFTQTSYDGMGRALTTTDQEGRVRKYAYDDVGNALSVTDPKNQVTQYSYDALNNLTSFIDAKGRATRFEYDALNRVIKRVLPLGMADLYTYDQIGNLATRTDFRGKQTSYEYDARNRLTAKRPDPTLGEQVITYTYTPTGKRSTMTDASGTTAYTYDNRDRLETKQTPQGTLTYTHDGADNLTSMVSGNADGVSVTYSYDDLSRLENVIDNRLASGTTQYMYDSVGNLKSDLRPNGVLADYTYNTLNRLTNLTHGKAGTNFASYAYTLDRTGRRLSATELGGRTVGYTYDEVYRLTRETVAGDQNAAGNGTVDYVYDSVGNRLSRISTLAGVLSTTSAYDANDRVTTDPHDANGNLRSADGKTYTYDFEDRIRTANGGAVRITYDGDGNLAAKTVGGVTTRYLVDDLNPTGFSQVVEEVVDGQVTRQYTYGNTIISQRQQLGGTWSASFYSLDGHGSVRQLTDSTGAVTDTYTYDGFGKLISQTGTTPNVYLYAGERFDPDLGLYHFRARHYSAERGRFTSMDPFAGFIEDPLSLHKYLYANADPVNFIDPSGLAALAEYGSLVKRIALRTVAALRALGRAIACVFLRVASWLASFVSYAAWAVVRALAARMGLAPCVCKPGNVPPVSGNLRDWLKDNPDLLQEALDWFLDFPQWQGIDPDRTPVNYRPPNEVRDIRRLPGESGGHHPHPLGLGGPPGQTLTPTGDTRRWKNPRHTDVTNLHNRIIRIIKGMCVK